MDDIRGEVERCASEISAERERIDEEKMTRLELEGEITEIRKQISKGVNPGAPKKANESLPQVGEDSALEEILPQIDELATKSSEFQKKITEIEISLKKPQKDGAVDAVVELTANLKAEFAQFRADTDQVLNNFEKVRFSKAIIIFF